MNLRRGILATAVSVSLLSLGALGTRPAFGGPRPPVEEAVVRLAPGASTSELVRLARDHGWRVSKVAHSADPGIARELWRVRQKGSSSTPLDSFLAAASRLSGVAKAVRNPTYRVSPRRGDGGAGAGGDDPYGGDQSEMPAFDDELDQVSVVAQPALEAIRAPEAHLRVQGRGVVVAVLDGGFDLHHQLLQGRLAPDLYDAISGDPDPQDGGNGFDDDGDFIPDGGLGHGTAVAGLVALAAPGAWILPVRVLDDEGRGDALSISLGIHGALDRGARVICLAASGSEHSPMIDEALERAWRQGALVVCSAGNEGQPSVNYPGCSPFAFCPLGTTPGGQLDPSSNYGSAVDLGAPSVDVLAPSPEGPTKYAHWHGTSFSTALCAGCAALTLEASPWMNGELAAWWLQVQSDYDAIEGIKADAFWAGFLDAASASMPL